VSLNAWKTGVWENEKVPGTISSKTMTKFLKYESTSFIINPPYLLMN
jgi:hypothetical protein